MFMGTGEFVKLQHIGTGLVEWLSDGENSGHVLPKHGPAPWTDNNMLT